MNLVTTGPALEAQPVAVSLLRVPASRAPLRGVSRVHCDDHEATVLGLVLQELRELVERPGVDFGAGLLAESLPLADPLQVFDGDGGASALLRELDDPLGCDVVHVPVEARFLAPQPFQSTTDAPRVLLCPSGLERGALLPVLGCDGPLVAAAKEQSLLAVCGYGGEANAPVNGNYGIVGAVDVGDLSLERHEQVDLASLDGQQSAAESPVGQVVGQTVGSVVGDLQAPTEGAERNTFCEESEVATAFAALEGDRFIVESQRLRNLAFQFTKRFIARGYDPWNGRYNLCGKMGVGADCSIASSLQFYCLQRFFRVERCFRCDITSIGECLDESKGFVQTQIDSYFGDSNDFHMGILLKEDGEVNLVNRRRS